MPQEVGKLRAPRVRGERLGARDPPLRFWRFVHVSPEGYDHKGRYVPRTRHVEYIPWGVTREEARQGQSPVHRGREQPTATAQLRKIGGQGRKPSRAPRESQRPTHHNDRRTLGGRESSPDEREEKDRRREEDWQVRTGEKPMWMSQIREKTVSTCREGKEGRDRQGGRRLSNGEAWKEQGKDQVYANQERGARRRFQSEPPQAKRDRRENREIRGRWGGRVGKDYNPSEASHEVKQRANPEQGKVHPPPRSGMTDPVEPSG